MRLIFFFKQKTAYELRISDWSSDVCASDLPRPCDQRGLINPPVDRASTIIYDSVEAYMDRHQGLYDEVIYGLYGTRTTFALAEAVSELEGGCNTVITSSGTSARSEEHTSELQSLMRISYAVFCWNKKKY